MRIAAHDGHSRQGQALFRSNDMHDALARITHIKQGEAKVSRVLLHGSEAQCALFIYYIEHTPARYRRYIMIEYSDGGVRVMPHPRKKAASNTVRPTIRTLSPT